MAKTIAQKLLLREGDAVAVIGASPEERALLGALPDGVADAEPADASAAVLFVRTTAELLERFGSVVPALGTARVVWFVYPKGGRADVNRDVIIRESGAFGWRPISNVAVDGVWSAVRVRPLAHSEAPVG